MDEDIKKVDIEYDADQNKFVIGFNDDVFSFSPNQYMEFINHSIVAINSIIAERFSNSLKAFLEDKTKKKETFSKKDGKLIADEIAKWFKENTIGG